MNASVLRERFIAGIISVLAALCAPAYCASLEQALDAPGLTWQSSSISWTGTETAAALDGVDAAQITAVEDEEILDHRLSTTVTGPGVLSFWWQIVESIDDESDFYLEVDGISVLRRDSEPFSWEQIAINVPAGAHTFTIVVHPDGPPTVAMVDQVVWTPGQRLQSAVALGDPNGFWVQQGDWTRVAGAARDGVGDAVIFQHLGNDDYRHLVRLTNGPATVRYWRKIDSLTPELYRDYPNEPLQTSWAQSTSVVFGTPGELSLLDLVYYVLSPAAPATISLDDVEITPLSLATSADFSTPGAIFTTSPGSQPWHVHYNESDLRYTGSPEISPQVTNGSADVRADFAGPGLLTWSWRKWSPFDETITVSVNGATIGVFTDDLDGSIGFAHAARVITTTGTNSVQWRLQWGSNPWNPIALDDILFSPPVAAGIRAAIEVNATAALYATAGTAWTPQALVTHDGVDALQLAVAGSSARAALTLPVTGPGILTWWWRSDVPGDSAFRLHREGREARSIAGNSGWRQEILAIRAGEEFVRWEYFRGGTAPTAAHRVWLDEISFIPQVITIAEAVDAPANTWVTSGDVLPAALPAPASHDGADTLILTGPHNWYQTQTWAETSFTGPGQLSFRAKIQEGPKYYGYSARIYVDGVYQRLVPPLGSDPWGGYSVAIPAGTHTVRWSPNSGTVMNLDEVVFTTIDGYDLWVQTHGLTLAQAGPLDDPEEDGVPNLLEYFFDFPPLKAQPATGTSVRTLPGGQMVMEFYRDIRQHDVTFSAEISADLFNWAEAPAIPVGQEGFKELLRVVLPPEKGFGRLKILRTP